MELKKDILEVKPTLIVALGNLPLKILTGKVGIAKWRGSILPCAFVPGVKVIPTYHPAAVLRQWEWNAITLADWRRIAGDSRFSELRLPERTLNLNPPHHTWHGISERLYAASHLSFDIECTMAGKLTCVGFADSADEGFTFAGDDPETLQLVSHILGSPSKKIAQNGQFDIAILKRYGIAVENFSFDTMLAQHCCHPEFDKGLGFLGSIYTREPYYKDDGKIAAESSDKDAYYRYNCKDATVTYECFERLSEELTELGTWDIFNHEMSLLKPLTAMTERGIRVSTSVCNQLKQKHGTEKADLEAKIKSILGYDLNVFSPIQMKNLLYKQLKLPVKFNRTTGTVTTGEEVLEELAVSSGHEVLRLIVGVRRKRKLISTYLDPKLDDDGRIRCDFKVAGTVTGRLASSQSLFGSGTNLQNIPEDARVMYRADDGMVLYYCDLSQAEARCVAWLAEDRNLKTLFADPLRDVHTENASRIFNIPMAEVSYNQRYIAKRCVHALNYGMGPKRFYSVINTDAPSTGIRVTMAEVNFLIKRYFDLFPAIREWHRSVQAKLQRTRSLRNPFGRLRTFHGRWGDELFRDAYAYVPQSTVADCLNKAIIQIADNVPNHGMLLQVHDAILGQCLPEELDSLVPKILTYMEAPIPFLSGPLSIPADVKVGQNWASASTTNPTGLHKWNPNGSGA